MLLGKKSLCVGRIRQAMFALPTSFEAKQAGSTKTSVNIIIRKSSRIIETVSLNFASTAFGLTKNDVWPEYDGPTKDTIVLDIYENWLEPIQ